ncbi:MAG: hypothetical protein M1834_006773 [Cirrosporium novae-zelandiae]|nr:MAG: hypothetical protein M1834_006773 [Cirrosporium novae-zelandiae]
MAQPNQQAELPRYSTVKLSSGETKSLSIPKSPPKHYPWANTIRNARVGILINELEGSYLWKATDLEARTVNGKTAEINIVLGSGQDTAYKGSINIYEAKDPKQKDIPRTLKNLYFISHSKDELPVYHFWKGDGGVDPLNPHRKTDWQRVFEGHERKGNAPPRLIDGRGEPILVPEVERAIKDSERAQERPKIGKWALPKGVQPGDEKWKEVEERWTKYIREWYAKKLDLNDFLSTIQKEVPECYYALTCGPRVIEHPTDSDGNKLELPTLAHKMTQYQLKHEDFTPLTGHEPPYALDEEEEKSGITKPLSLNLRAATIKPVEFPTNAKDTNLQFLLKYHQRGGDGFIHRTNPKHPEKYIQRERPVVFRYSETPPPIIVDGKELQMADTYVPDGARFKKSIDQTDAQGYKDQAYRHGDPPVPNNSGRTVIERARTYMPSAFNFNPPPNRSLIPSGRPDELDDKLGDCPSDEVDDGMDEGIDDEIDDEPNKNTLNLSSNPGDNVEPEKQPSSRKRKSTERVPFGSTQGFTKATATSSRPTPTLDESYSALQDKILREQILNSTWERPTLYPTPESLASIPRKPFVTPPKTYSSGKAPAFSSTSPFLTQEQSSSTPKKPSFTVSGSKTNNEVAAGETITPNDSWLHEFEKSLESSEEASPSTPQWLNEAGKSSQPSRWGHGYGSVSLLSQSKPKEPLGSKDVGRKISSLLRENIEKLQEKKKVKLMPWSLYDSIDPLKPKSSAERLLQTSMAPPIEQGIKGSLNTPTMYVRAATMSEMVDLKERLIHAENAVLEREHQCFLCEASFAYPLGSAWDKESKGYYHETREKIKEHYENHRKEYRQTCPFCAMDWTIWADPNPSQLRQKHINREHLRLEPSSPSPYQNQSHAGNRDNALDDSDSSDDDNSYQIAPNEPNPDPNNPPRQYCPVCCEDVTNLNFTDENAVGTAHLKKCVADVEDIRMWNMNTYLDYVERYGKDTAVYENLMKGRKLMKEGALKDQKDDSKDNKDSSKKEQKAEEKNKGEKEKKKADEQKRKGKKRGSSDPLKYSRPQTRSLKKPRLDDWTNEEEEEEEEKEKGKGKEKKKGKRSSKRSRDPDDEFKVNDGDEDEDEDDILITPSGKNTRSLKKQRTV